MAGPYRDALIGRKIQAQGLRSNIKILEQRITPLLRNHLPPSLIDELVQLQDQGEVRQETMQEYDRAIDALEQYQRRLEQAISLEPEVRRALVTPAPTAPNLVEFHSEQPLAVYYPQLFAKDLGPIQEALIQIDPLAKNTAGAGALGGPGHQLLT